MRPKIKLQKHLFKELMDHQVQSIFWLMSLWNRKPSIGGILADDMGMGKTISIL